MLRSTPIALLLAMTLALAGCGDDGGGEDLDVNPFGDGGPSLPYGIDPSKIDMAGKEGAEAAKHFGEQFMKGVTNTQLTEKSLAKLYEVHTQLEGMADSDDVAAKLAVFREHGVNMGAYTASLMKLESLKSILRRGVDRTKEEYAEAVKKIDELKEKAKTATGDAKAAAEQQVQMYEMMLPAVKSQMDQAKELADPEFRALIEKWAAKFEAVGK